MNRPLAPRAHLHVPGRAPSRASARGARSQCAARRRMRGAAASAACCWAAGPLSSPRTAGAAAHGAFSEVPGAGSFVPLVRDLHRGTCVYSIPYRPKLSIYTQYRHIADTTSSNGCKSGAVHRNLRKKQKQLLDFMPSFWTQWAQEGAE